MSIMKIDHEKCVRCGECVDACPFGVPVIEDDQVVIGSNCRFCGTCEMTCHHLGKRQLGAAKGSSFYTSSRYAMPMTLTVTILLCRSQYF